MQIVARLLAIALLLAVASSGQAQCNRGGSQSRASPGIGTSFNSFPNSFTQSISPAQMQNQIAQQRMMYAMQQRYRQALAQRSRNLNSQLASSRSSRQQQLRLRNAQKLMQSAMLAGSRGNASSAEKTLRRVVRLVGKDGELGQQAVQLLTALRDETNERDVTSPSLDDALETLLVSTER